MKKRKFFLMIPVVLVCFVSFIGAQQTVTNISVNADLTKDTISKHIYGHFSEHLGIVYMGEYGLERILQYQIPGESGMMLLQL